MTPAHGREHIRASSPRRLPGGRGDLSRPTAEPARGHGAVVLRPTFLTRGRPRATATKSLASASASKAAWPPDRRPAPSFVGATDCEPPGLREHRTP